MNEFVYYNKETRCENEELEIIRQLPLSTLLCALIPLCFLSLVVCETYPYLACVVVLSTSTLAGLKLYADHCALTNYIECKAQILENCLVLQHPEYDKQEVIPFTFIENVSLHVNGENTFHVCLKGISKTGMGEYGYRYIDKQLVKYSIITLPVSACGGKSFYGALVNRPGITKTCHI